MKTTLTVSTTQTTSRGKLEACLAVMNEAGFEVRDCEQGKAVQFNVNGRIKQFETWNEQSNTGERFAKCLTMAL